MRWRTMTATIAEIVDSETRNKLQNLRTFLEGKERKFQKLKRGKPPYAPSTMSDKEISKLHK